ncbi:hypothetical protein V8G54_031191 [Vigna mungo]|uniref:Uncharacterized protein n=1 Tax=Vigna mungo TaxID=3915 RepID=A0AAQ3RP87_VIGMU
MGSCRLLGIMVMFLFLLFPLAAKGDNNITDSFLDKVCEEVECGKGSCVVNTSYPLNFICECESGWTRTQDEDDDKFATSFLPCVIPQCSLNYGCQPAPPPVPEKSFPHNLSAFNRKSTLGSDCSKLGIKVGDSTANQGEIGPFSFV